MVLELAICELYIPNIHGQTEKSTKNISGQYIINTIISTDDFYLNEYKDTLQEIELFWRNIITTSHPVINNINNIIHHQKYIILNIVDTHQLDGNELIAIIKTGGLKIFQRHYKSYYKQLQLKISKMKTIKHLRYRETTGKWPKY